MFKHLDFEPWLVGMLIVSFLGFITVIWLISWRLMNQFWIVAAACTVVVLLGLSWTGVYGANQHYWVQQISDELVEQHYPKPYSFNSTFHRVSWEKDGCFVHYALLKEPSGEHVVVESRDSVRPREISPANMIELLQQLTTQAAHLC